MLQINKIFLNECNFDVVCKLAVASGISSILNH